MTGFAIGSGPRPGFGKKSLLHHLGRLHQQRTEQARRNVSALSDRFGKEAIVRRALDHLREA